MAEQPKDPKSENAGGGADDPADQSWKDLVESLGKRALTALLTAGGLAAFAAFAGSIVLWTRFHALQLPADQIIEVVPRSEAITAGTTILLLFGFCGALATLAVYLIDRGGRATPGMSRGVVLIVAAEAIAVIWLATGVPKLSQVLATEIVVLAFGAILWATHVGGLVNLKAGEEEELANLPGEKEEAQEFKPTAFRDQPDTWTGGRRKAVFAVLVAAGLGLASWLVIYLAVSTDAIHGLIWALGVTGLALLSATFLCWYRFSHPDSSNGPPAVETSKERRKPLAAELTSDGTIFLGFLVGVAVASPAILLRHDWLVITLLAIVVAGLGLWRIADLSSGRFTWYGVAVFLSVPLIGTIALASRNIDDPQAQPVAIIRKGDGPDKALQGIYVTETDKRVYFANVATQACDKTIVGGSGRLLWVPKDDVVAMAIGPEQDIDKAARSSLEMAYALTPDIETSGGAHIRVDREGPTPRPEALAGGSKKADAEVLGDRLLGADPAIRPKFGRGLRLEPEVASPGDRVKLFVSSPEYNGLRGLPEGRSLRLNGVKLPILHDKKAEEEDKIDMMERKVSLRELREEKLEFEVPGKATSGIVTVECTQLAGQPYLAIPQKPKARIAVKVQAGSRGVRFDSSGSVNTAGKDVGLTRRWTVAGLRMGHETNLTVTLPPRLAPYHVRLDVTDSEGGEDHVNLRLLRLPQSRFPFGADRMVDTKPMNRVREALREAIDKEREAGQAPAHIEIDGHADSVDTDRFNLGLSLRRARWLRRQLFVLHGDALAASKGAGVPLANKGNSVPLTVRAFGESCPIVKKPGPQAVNRRVEVFLLDQGASVATPKTCQPGRVRLFNW